MDELTRLALAARDGDRHALGAFVRDSQAEVWRLCRHLGGADWADDLTQEAYARALAGLDRFRGDATARTWLLSIARRTAADRVRAARRERRHHLVRGGADADPAAVVSTESLLEALDDDQRAALVLTQILGLSYADAAAVCEVAVGTIRSRVARARSRLREQLERAANA